MSELDHASMDLEQDEARAGAVSVADNACCESGRSTEENFAASGVGQGMDIEREEGEGKKSAQIEEDGHKAEVSSSGTLVVGAAAVTAEEEEEEDRPALRPRRSDASKTRTKTRSSSLTSGKASESRGTRKRGEDGEELRSSSEELNNHHRSGGGVGGGDGDDEVDGTAYRCGICNEDFESARSLSLHKKFHPQYTLRRNPKRSRKLIDQEFAVDAAAAGGGGAAATTGTSGGTPSPLQTAAPTTKKTSSMSEEFPRPCTECGKEFASWKALFGHMRCHPEREWRGIQPPAEKHTTHTDSAQGSGGAAPASVRRKKPQLPPAPSVITFQEDPEKSASLDSKRAAAPAHAGKASDNESDTDSFEAVYMTNGDRHTVTGWMTGKRSKRSRQTHRSLDAVGNAKKELSASTNNVMTESNDMIEALMLLHSADKEKLTIPVTPDSHKTTTASRSKSRTPESGLEAEELSAKRVKAEPDVASSPCNDTEDGADDFDAGEQGSSARSKYECTTCKRQFKSHQALGGHRASHKKVKGCFARTNVSDGTAHEQSVDSMTEPEDDIKSEDNNINDHPHPFPPEAEATSPHNHNHHHHSEEESGAKPCYLTAARDDNEEMMLSLSRKAKAHECSICHRVFTSGQALGGHKRCHWGGGNGIPESAAAAAAATKPSTGRSMLKEGVTLDLNLPAPECLEEMEESGMSYRFFEIMHKEQSPPLPTSGGGSATGDDQVVVAAYKPLVAAMALVPGLTPTSA